MVALIAVLIAAMLIMTATVAWQRRNENLASGMQELRNLSTVLAELSDRTFLAAELVVEATAEDALLSGVENSLPREQRDELLRARIAGVPQIAGLAVIGRGGQIAASAHPHPDGSEYGLPSPWRQAQHRSRTGITVWLPERDGASGDGEAGMPIVRNLHSPSGRFEGQVVALVDPRYLAGVYASLRLRHDAQVTLVRDDGHPVIRFPPTEARLEGAVEPIRQMGLEVRHRIGSAMSGRAEEDGSTWLFARAYLPRFPFYVEIRMSQDSVLALWAQRLLVIGAAVLGIALVLAATTGLLVRQLVRQERSEAHALEQANLIRTVFDTAPNAIFVKDRDGRFVAVNRDMAESWNLPAFAMAGRRVQELVAHSPDEDRAIREEDARVMEDGQDVEARRWSARDLRRHFVHVYKRPLRDAAGLITGLVGISVDETRRIEAEAAMQRAHALLTTVLDTIPLAIWVQDEGGRLALVNRTAAERWNLSVRQMSGMRWIDLPMPTDVRERDAETDALVRNDGRVMDFEVERAFLDGTLHRLRVIKAPIRDESGAVTSTLSVSEDITESHHLRQEKANLERQLNQIQKLETVGRLAGGIAHDFNNLLTPIRGYAEIGLAKLPRGHAISGGLTRIIEATSRAAELTRSLLSFSRAQTLELVALDLNAVVKSVIDMIGRLIGEGIEITLNLDPRTERILADRTLIDQVLMNLVVNARDAMPQGGRIIIETSNVELNKDAASWLLEVPPGDYVLLTVSDTGTGMDAETMAKVFEPFFTTKEAGKGTGLGLSIVHGIVRQHRGTIQVYSEPWRGTTFKLMFPCHNAEAAAANMREERPVSPQGEERLLVVDDDGPVRRLVSSALESQGYEVLQADSPQSALKLVESEKGAQIDLLVSDVVMPGMDGAELYALLRKRLPHLRVLYMSGHPRQALNGEGDSGHVVHFISKPFSIHRLANLVRHALDNGEAPTLE